MRNTFGALLYKSKKAACAAFKKVNKGTGGVPPPPSFAKV